MPDQHPSGTDSPQQDHSSNGPRPSPTLERMKQAAELDKRIAQRMGQVKHKIVVLSGKGGVGKTAIAANIGLELFRRQFTVGLLDADIHGPNLPKVLGLEGARVKSDGQTLYPVEPQPGLKVISIGFLLQDDRQPVIWRGPLKGSLLRQFLGDVDWGALDFLIVDNPPGTGDEPLTVAQSIPDADGAVIVTLPDELSLLDCRKAVNFARALNLRVLGVIENMSGFVCPYCGKESFIFGRGGGEKMAAEMGAPFLGRIPLLPRRAEDEVTAGPQWDSEQGRNAFARVVDNLLGQIAVSGG